MANEFVARNGLIALNNSQVTGSLDITGSLNVTEHVTASVFSASLVGGTGVNFIGTSSHAGTAFFSRFSHITLADSDLGYPLGS